MFEARFVSRRLLLLNLLIFGLPSISLVAGYLIILTLGFPLVSARTAVAVFGLGGSLLLSVGMINFSVLGLIENFYRKRSGSDSYVTVGRFPMTYSYLRGQMWYLLLLAIFLCNLIGVTINVLQFVSSLSV